MSRSVSNLEDHVGYWLRFVSNHVSHSFAAKVETEGVTVAEWVVLREMFAQSSVNPSQLAERLGVTRGAVSKLIDRLVSKSLVEKQMGKAIASNLDGRYQTVDLTPAGRRLVPKLAKLADKNDEDFFGHLSSKQKADLVRILKELVRANGLKNIPVK